MLTAIMILAIIYWKPLAMGLGGWLILGTGFAIVRAIARSDSN